MKAKASVATRLTAQPRPKAPIWQAIIEKEIVPKHHPLQPPKNPPTLISDLLGDYSDQTGANFG